MNTEISNVAIGAIVIAVAIAITAYALARRDDCMDKARGFVMHAPVITALVGKVISAGSSSWLSGQAASKPGERTFYFLLKGERGTANAIVSADRATCTCRVASVR